MRPTLVESISQPGCGAAPPSRYYDENRGSGTIVAPPKDPYQRFGGVCPCPRTDHG